MNYGLHIMIVLCIYMMLATSLNLIAGTLGVISIAHAAFYAIGAYTTALLRTQGDASLVAVLVMSIITAGVAGMALAIPAIRLRNLYFLIGTLAFQILIQNLAMNWTPVTGGAIGISGITPGSVFGWRPDAPTEFLLLALAVLLGTTFIVYLLTNSPAGRTLRAMREDELYSASRGKNIGRYKIQAFSIACAIAGLAGSLHAQYTSFITPTGFTVMESVFILSMVVLGGRGSVWGALLGAAVLVLIPESLRFLGFPTAIAAELRMLLYGLALVACMLWRPQGLIGEYAFGREAKQK